MSANDQPNITTAAYDRMMERAELPLTLMGGTPAMRAMAEEYLPHHPAESSVAYELRKRRAVLRNYFRLTVSAMTGKVFAKEMQLGEDVPPRLAELAENIDLAGRHISIFAREAFKKALVPGLSYILVDYPPAEDARSLAEERQRGARPYWVLLEAEDVIGVRYETQGGQIILTQLRIHRCFSEPVGAFGEQDVEEVRVLDLVREETEAAHVAFTIWRKIQPNDKRRKAQWEIHQEGRMSIPVIPLVPVYTGYVAPFEAVPPLEDLAYMNLEHFQIRSDQRNALNVASFPILAATGVKDEAEGGDDEAVIGPNQYLTSDNEAAKFYYVESNGAHLEAGRKELQDLEEAMRAFGVQFQVRQSGAESATGRVLDANEVLSPLQAMALGLKDAIENALQLTAMWEGLPEGGSVTVNTELSLTATEAAEVQALIAARQAGEISRERFVTELRRRGILDDDYDPEEDAGLLALEGPALGLLGEDDDEDDDPPQDDE